MLITRLFILLFLFGWLTTSCDAQNDISDIFDDKNFEILNEVSLPKDLNETSGLLYIDSLVLSFNDSGNKPTIFGIDPITASIKYEWEIKNAKNNDWEDIAQDEEFIYIGDFGNNFGKRKDLTIYKIKKSDLFEENEGIEAEIIGFVFEDQTDFTASFYEHSFDCEAMICEGDSIFVFSKDWKNIKTTKYSLPKTPGNYTAKKGSVFNTEGLITGADYNKDSNTLILIGYLNYEPFLWIFKNFSGTDFFAGASRRIDLTEKVGIQNEGVCFHHEGTILMSSEKKNFPATLFEIEINNL